MRALFIGGTGVISTAISRLAIKKGWDLYLLNRGNKPDFVAEGAKILQADIQDTLKVSNLIRELQFDVVVDFIVLVPEQIERDIELFSGKTKQYIFISSASAYQKPLPHYQISESTALANPYWEYSRNKIACEERLMYEYRKNGFPATIVRPSHTYNETSIPLAIYGKKGRWQVIDRILKGKPVLIHGDGTSIWTVTHSSDFAKAFCEIMANPAAIAEAIHITSDEALTWNQIYDRIGDALNVRVKKFHVASDFLIACNPYFEGTLAGDKSNSVIFDNSKIKRLVPDYVPTVRFDQGARISMNYMLSHPEVQIPDEEFDKFCDRVIEVQEKAIAQFRQENG